MLLSNLEYVPLRLLRKFVFRRAFLETCGWLIPYYLTNRGETSPQSVVSAYFSYLRECNIRVDGMTTLELGSGATNGTGYELAARKTTRVYCLEPFARFRSTLDQSILSEVCNRHHVKPDDIAGRTVRLNNFNDIPPQSIDLVVSSSVLEHVADLGTLCSDLKRVLTLSGKMLHLVDYRDHFFKYPYHFLQFSRRTWKAFLDPGDLPRWRLTDHLHAFARAGFETRVLAERSEPGEFARVAPYINQEFDRSDSRLAITFAALLTSRRDAG